MSNKRQQIPNKVSFLHRLYTNRAFLLMVLPGVAALIAFNYLPMFGIVIAFKNINYTKGILNSDWVGLKNFEFFIKTPDALLITRNTVLYNLSFIILGLVASVTCAILLNEVVSNRLRKFYQSALFLPYFVSWMVVSYLVYAFLNADYGFVNRIALSLFGLKAGDWYSKLSVWPFFIVFLNLWKFTGYNSIIYFASIMNIDPELYEAAEVDGASKLQQIFKITVPHLVPIMTILTILAVGRIFNADFGLFYQTTMKLGNGILKPVANVLDTYVYDSLINIGDLGMASAASLYQSVIGFVVVLAANAIVKKIDRDNSLF